MLPKAFNALDVQLFGYREIQNAADEALPERPAVKWIGISFTDDPSGNRTVGTIALTNALHGNLGGGSLHELADGSQHGFMPSDHWSVVQNRSVNAEGGKLPMRDADGGCGFSFLHDSSTPLPDQGFLRHSGGVSMALWAVKIDGNNAPLIVFNHTAPELILGNDSLLQQATLAVKASGEIYLSIGGSTTYIALTPTSITLKAGTTTVTIDSAGLKVNGTVMTVP